jgi:CRISPR-associated protein Csx17
MASNNILRIDGCRSQPLASYLKALAVLRLVNEQKDSAARGWWGDGVFYMESTLDKEALSQFFLHEYKPTPIAAPWNGGSGFFPGDSKTGMIPIEESSNHRFDNYRETISLCKRILEGLDINSPPSGQAQKPLKEKLLIECRMKFPDDNLLWLDAAYVLTPDGVRFPPLLGTGGNDGRLEFTNNFMQRVIEMIDPETGQPRDNSNPLCRAALWAESAPGLKKKIPIGQFQPGNAGGANAGPGYDDDSLINPWDFILLMEGAVMFGAAVSKRLKATEPGTMTAPFMVRPSRTGYASAAPGDKARAEIWLPLWGNPASSDELKILLSEGRSQVGRRSSCDGVDFARSIATLGVDRGISAFQRMGFIERNGQAYLATPLGCWPVLARPDVYLVDDLDQWLDRLRSAALFSRSPAPASFGRSLRTIENAILSVCRDGYSSQWQRLLMAVGEAERQMVKSPQTTASSKHLAPIPRLRPEWLEKTYDASPEFHLAASLASIWDRGIGPIRANMVPLDLKVDYPAFKSKKMDDNSVVWGGGRLVDNLVAVLSRRLLEFRQGEHEDLPLEGRQPASLDHIRRFIEGAVDETKIERLLWGLNAIDWRRVKPLPLPPYGDDMPVPTAYALLKLAHSPIKVKLDWAETGVDVPLDPVIFHRAKTGQINASCRIATGRLRASGLTPKAATYNASTGQGRRMAAAILFPLREADIMRLARMMLKKPQ